MQIKDLASSIDIRVCAQFFWELPIFAKCRTSTPGVETHVCANKRLSITPFELPWLVRCSGLLAAPSTEIIFPGTPTTQNYRGRSEQRPTLDGDLTTAKSTHISIIFPAAKSAL
jgi:hypothetical protein